MDRRAFVVSIAALLASASPALAGDIVYTCGGDQGRGRAMAEPTGGQWSPTLSKAFELATGALEGNSEVSVVIRAAAGTHDGDGKGSYALPAINNVKASFRLEGGWKEDFGRRDPFKYPTKIVTIQKRNAPLLTIHTGQGAACDKMRLFALDGIVFDVANSNAYDNHGNLRRSGSAGNVMIDFNGAIVERLLIQNCVFANGPGGAFETKIRALTDACDIQIVNSIFLNCVCPVRLDTSRSEGVANRAANVSKIVVDHCSFISSWSFDGTAEGMNPAALDVGPREAAKEFLITNNLFYASFGGAILCLHKQNPKLTIRNNLFAGNGFLSGTPDMGAVAMIVDAGAERENVPADRIEEVKNVVDGTGNVTLTPGIPLALSEPKLLEADKVKAEKTWDDEVKRLLGKTNMAGAVPKVKDYAPKKEYDPANPPLPTRPNAKKYGASPDLVR